ASLFALVTTAGWGMVCIVNSTHRGKERAMPSSRLATMLVAGAAITGLYAATADASLVIDVRAFSMNGSTAAITNSKQVVVAPVDTIVFRVFADVTGQDDAKFQCLQSHSGSFLSTGSMHGDLMLSPAGITAPFNANASTGGQQSDLD